MWRCAACEERYDPYASHACCPRCAVVWSQLSCPLCDARSHQADWYLEPAERAAFMFLISAPPLKTSEERLYEARMAIKQTLLPNAEDLFGSDPSPELDPVQARAGLILAEERDWDVQVAHELAARAGWRALESLPPAPPSPGAYLPSTCLPTSGGATYRPTVLNDLPTALTPNLPAYPIPKTSLQPPAMSFLERTARL